MEMTYEKFINNILETRGRFACGKEYHERHHIIPRCMGGTDDEDNLIDLFAKEHFEAHRLLALENPDDDKLVYAWSCMAFANNNYEDRYELSADEYEEIRKLLSVTMKNKFVGENNPMYGKKHTEATKEKISAALKGKYVGENNHFYDVHLCGEDNPFYGKKHSEETKRKLGGYKAGKPGIRLGTHHTEEAKKKISEYRKGKFKVKIDQFNLDGDFIQTWDGIKQASDALGIQATNISACCRGVKYYHQAGGFIWRYADEENQEFEGDINYDIQSDMPEDK